MSYQVIARKWRPQAFDDLVGQNHISTTLLNALKSGRLAHAILLTGPRGTGKTSTARILAKALRCPNAKDFVPCHKCSECEDIAQGRSLNVIEIDGASNNGVDAIRELRDTVAYRPSTGNYKMYIIDEVHMLSTSAFNALLKTLEEPPDHVIFVMATTEVNKIPITILSRCQRFDFRRIPTQAIAQHLQKICEKEKVQAAPEALWAIARQAEGSMRDSQSLLDQVITFSGANLTLQKTVECLGLTDRALLLEALTALTTRDAQAILKLVEKIYTAGQDAKIFAQELLEEVRHLLLVKMTAPEAVARIVDLPQTEIETLRGLGATLSQEDIHLLFDMALKGVNDLLRAHDPRLMLEMLLLRMAVAPRIESLVNLSGARTAPAVTNSSMAKPRPTSTGAESPTPAATPAPIKSAGSLQWVPLVEKIKKLNPVMGAKLENCFLARIEGKHLVVGVPPQVKFLYDQIKDPGFVKKLASYVETLLGPGHTVAVEMGKDADVEQTPKREEEKKVQAEKDELQRQVEAHPLVQSAQKNFKAQIKNIKEIR